jgi:hypothetical protein
MAGFFCWESDKKWVYTILWYVFVNLLIIS